MFGFLRRRILKEHMKLFAQTHKALGYCQAFLSADQAENIRRVLETIQSSWAPGERMAAKQVEVMLAANKVLRRAYDASPARLAGMKKFDDQFVPLLGWDDYFSQYLD